MLSRLHLLILLTLIATAKTAFADGQVLFLDTNDSKEEVQLVQELSRKTGKTFKKFPSILADSDRHWLAAFAAETSKIQNKKTRLGCQTDSDSKACQDIEARLSAMAKRKSELQDSQQIDTGKAFAWLQDQLNSGSTSSTVFISGHHGTDGFYGNNGSLNVDPLQELSEKNPSVLAKVSTVYLLGCYTTTVASLIDHWRHVFKNAGLFIGFSTAAPLSARSVTGKVIKDLWNHEKDFTQKSLEDLKKIYTTLAAAQTEDIAILSGDNYVSKAISFHLSEADLLCESSQVIKDTMDKYQCHFQASDLNCANPPKDPHSSEIRNLYDQAKIREHCYKMQKFAPLFMEFASVDEMIRLIYWQNVKKNFVASLSQEIAETDQILKDLGAPPELRFSGLLKMSRSDVISLNRSFDAFLLKQEDILGSLAYRDLAFEKPATLVLQAKIEALRTFYLASFYGLSFLNKYYIPFSWTGETTKEKSDMIEPMKKVMGFSGLLKSQKGKTSKLGILRTMQAAVALEKSRLSIDADYSPWIINSSFLRYQRMVAENLRLSADGEKIGFAGVIELMEKDPKVDSSESEISHDQVNFLKLYKTSYAQMTNRFVQINEERLQTLDQYINSKDPNTLKQADILALKYQIEILSQQLAINQVSLHFDQVAANLLTGASQQAYEVEYQNYLKKSSQIEEEKSIYETALSLIEKQPNILWKSTPLDRASFFPEELKALWKRKAKDKIDSQIKAKLSDLNFMLSSARLVQNGEAFSGQSKWLLKSTQSLSEEYLWLASQRDLLIRYEEKRLNSLHVFEAGSQPPEWFSMLQNVGL